MKLIDTPLALRALVLAALLSGSGLQARDSEPAPASPDIQALTALLNKLLAQSTGEAAPTAEPAPAAEAETAPAPTPAAKPPVVKQASATGLRTGTLTTGSLTRSAPLGGRGPAPASGQQPQDDWRQLFPLRQPVKTDSAAAKIPST